MDRQLPAWRQASVLRQLRCQRDQQQRNLNWWRQQHQLHQQQWQQQQLTQEQLLQQQKQQEQQQHQWEWEWVQTNHPEKAASIASKAASAASYPSTSYFRVKYPEAQKQWESNFLVKFLPR